MARQSPIRVVRWLPAVLLGCGLTGAVVGMITFNRVSIADEQLKVKPLFKGTANGETQGKKIWDYDALKKKYAFEPIAPRLKYETEAAQRKTKSTEKPAARPELAKESATRLAELEHNLEYRAKFDTRTRSLADLHADKLQNFVNSPGFGGGRMMHINPAPDYLELAEPPPMAFAKVSEGSTEEAAAPRLPLPKDIQSRGESAARLPAQPMLSDLHNSSRYSFLNFPALGHVNHKKEVAGFLGHAFTAPPMVNEPPPNVQSSLAQPLPAPKSDWHVTRLELVSLLKHDKPAVYVSKHLPKMNELKDAKTRRLDEFEQLSLETLLKGEDLATEATLNRIQMLGAVRATKQCLECHSVERGDLLGAFSYELRRDPPVKADTAVKPAT